MEYATLGRTGLRVSKIGYGGAGLGNMYTPADDKDAEQCVRKAVEEYGINLFDTSPSYGMDSLGEIRMGEILSHGLRDKVVLMSKCGDWYLKDQPGQHFRDFTAETILNQADEQLKRLKTDCLDVLILHDMDAEDPDFILNETLPAMEKLKQAGKTRFIGMSSVVLSCLKEVAEKTDAVDVILTFGKYNLMDTSAKGYFDELLKTKNFGLLNCSVLFMGALSKKALLPNQKMTMHLFDRIPGSREALKKACDLCEKNGVDLAELAVQFGCDCDCCDSTIISMARTVRLDQNMELLSKPYDHKLAQEVYEILHPYSIIPTVPWKLFFNQSRRIPDYTKREILNF